MNPTEQHGSDLLIPSCKLTGRTALVGFGLLAAVTLLVFPAPQSAHAANFTVNSTADTIDAAPGDSVCADASGNCTLRAAIMEANALAGADTITLPAGTYTLSVAGTGENAATTGDLDITGDLTINGAGTASTIVDGGGIDRVFEVHPGVTVLINAVTVRNGNPGGASGGGILNKGTLTLDSNTISGNTGGNGGGIFNDGGGMLTLDSSSVSGNTSRGNGGGIYNYSLFPPVVATAVILNSSTVTGNTASGAGGISNFGTLTLNSSTVSGNTATSGEGGGILNLRTLTLNRSTVSGNMSRGNGGGIYNVLTGGISAAIAILNSSTVSGNTVSQFHGGGIANVSGTLTLTNSTISGNSTGASGLGGGIWNLSGTLSVASGTLSGNSAGGSNLNNGGGIQNTSGTTVIKNTILANNSPRDCVGVVTVTGRNFIEAFGACSLVGSGTVNGGFDPLLGPLANNGGPTMTHALLVGSAAIDAVPLALCTDASGNPLVTDQRGMPRPHGAACDIGAFEGLANNPPVAVAGADQAANEGATVLLDGSGSNDPEDDALTYTWSQTGGTSVVLSDIHSPTPTFTAPSVTPGGETLTFQLIVNDGELDSEPDTVNITVKNVNQKPVAEAGGEQTVNEGTLVMLNGSASYDLDGEPITYSWLQTAGPSVTLSDSSAAQPTFTAPYVGWSGATLSFALTVNDGIDDSVPDYVNVYVENVNHPPVANAGPDQTKNEGSLVDLNGTNSNDPDTDPITYAWTQVSGPAVVLSDASSVTPSFTAPPVGPGGATLEFELTVGDGLLTNNPAVGEPDERVRITVQNVNDPPVCRLALPTLATLWPPNHKLISVGIVGITDPDKDGVVITITGVTQDELVNGLGDGDTSPDAVIQGDKVLLRAERSGKGNGRVYRINFTATDNEVTGGSCNASVNVGVPQSMKPGQFAVDDGQLYDSTQP